MANPIHGKGAWSETSVPPRAHADQPRSAQMETASRRVVSGTWVTACMSEGPRDRKRKDYGPQDNGLRDQGTKGLRDHRTTGPQDQETKGPKDYETTGLRTTDPSPSTSRLVTVATSLPNLPASFSTA